MSNTPPEAFKLTAIVALLWNLLGLFMVLMMQFNAESMYESTTPPPGRLLGHRSPCLQAPRDA